MNKLPEHFRLNLNGVADPRSIVQGKNYRFTVLTSQMLRMEYSEDGIFEDRPTQVVWNRNFTVPEFTVNDRPDCLEIDTEYFHLVYDKKEFGPNHLYIDVKYAFTNYGGRWYYGRTEYGDPPRKHNLKGTARTLDRCDGDRYLGSNLLEQIDQSLRVDLGFGLCDTSGRTFFEDGNSSTIDEDGWLHPRKKGCIDTYFLGYGRDYFKAIHDFYMLSGPIPMLPKYALGNWWSRYWKYTEESYKELLTDFEKRNIPFSVVIMDMDWHLVDIPTRFGRGWTGYTWNKEYFPDPERFLNWLHEHNYRVALNLHPADGVRAFEEQYPEMAKALGVNPESEYPVRFDFTNIEFVRAYFDYLHHPHEEQGVDFWWMDWQQGNISAVEGLDPLWMLNHYHHYDLRRDGKRGIMASRYGGLGSHRYPIGFSGDVHTTWESIQYQPYFTATAANVGYTWWSHDIGGFMKGIKDNELYIRWLQLGVFSPINRLHSCNNSFVSKVPWNYPSPYCEIAEETLRLRHRLLPYVYTMNYQCHNDMVPVVVPVYYYYPMDMGSYRYRNEYFFGDQLLVQPMVHPTDKETGRTAEQTWIPKGIWTDVYDGKIYHGGEKGRDKVITRPIDRQGVLAKAGAIVPMADIRGCEKDISNPQTLEIYVFPGGSNTYVLYEDEGDGFAYEKGVWLKTTISLDWKETSAVLNICPEGDFSVIPDRRKYVVHFRGFKDVEVASASEGYERSYDKAARTLTLTFEGADPERELSVELQGDLLCDNSDLQERAFALLNGFQGSVNMKDSIFQCIKNGSSEKEMLGSILAFDPPESWKQVLTEMITG
ncbi:MAG: DUF5110 domain-containing protein [Lachnospiraceae bacterium]|nr:DUF5110 domain-containing protein [Lachnospiraceae bacterium]